MATFYVRKSGNDANAGTSAGAAKLTITAAYNASSAGDTIYVGAGVYRETASLTISKASLSIIGDYSGAQTGDAGAVRWHGSAADVTFVTGAATITVAATGVTLRFLAISCSAASHAISMSGSASASNLTVSDCVLDGAGYLIAHSYVSALPTGVVIERCLFAGVFAVGIWYYQGDSTDRTPGWTIRNCVFVGGGASGTAVRSDHGGGLAMKNCTVIGPVPMSVNGTGTMSTPCTFTHCLVCSGAWWANSQTAGFLTEDYNVFQINSGYSARNGVSAGANSLTRVMLFDARAWFTLVSGGILVAPWDIGADWQMTNHAIGAAGYATDARGATVLGANREVGALEYNSALSVSGGSALGLPIVGSAIVRGAE